MPNTSARMAQFSETTLEQWLGYWYQASQTLVTD